MSEWPGYLRFAQIRRLWLIYVSVLLSCSWGLGIGCRAFGALALLSPGPVNGDEIRASIADIGGAVGNDLLHRR